MARDFYFGMMFGVEIDLYRLNLSVFLEWLVTRMPRCMMWFPGMAMFTIGI